MCKSMKYEFLKMQTKPLKSQPKGGGKGWETKQCCIPRICYEDVEKIYAQHTYLPEISL